MKRLFLVLGTAIVVLPWLSGARAQADAIHWTASMSLPGGSGGDGAVFILPQNEATAQIGLLPGNTTSGTNSGSVVLASVYASDQSNINATFGGPSADYSLRLTLHDSASGASGSLTFGGNLSGFINLPDEGAPAPITNTFLGPTTQTLTLGGNLYTVTMGSFVPPDNPTGPTGGEGPWAYGSISASIAVQPAANSTPEPSSLVLACLGLPSLGLARWFRRRKGVNSSAG
ncbi:MAG TPA: PEP-CTERM sorting domain-containing protein [Gemmataceae bacterium]|jgi:hypothetical protein